MPDVTEIEKAELLNALNSNIKLRETMRRLLVEHDHLSQVKVDAKRYYKALQKIICLNIPMPDEVYKIANNALENDDK